MGNDTASVALVLKCAHPDARAAAFVRAARGEAAAAQRVRAPTWLGACHLENSKSARAFLLLRRWPVALAALRTAPWCARVRAVRSALASLAHLDALGLVACDAHAAQWAFGRSGRAALVDLNGVLARPLDAACAAAGGCAHRCFKLERAHGVALDELACDAAQRCGGAFGAASLVFALASQLAPVLLLAQHAPRALAANRSEPAVFTELIGHARRARSAPPPAFAADTPPSVAATLWRDFLRPGMAQRRSERPSLRRVAALLDALLRTDAAQRCLADWGLAARVELDRVDEQRVEALRSALENGTERVELAFEPTGF